MDEIRSKVARYIAGEIQVGEMVDNSRLSVPTQKRFKFEDTWITMNRMIGEAVTRMNSLSEKRTPQLHSQPPPITVKSKRRNAVAVVDPQTRLMTNGCKWPSREDWVIGSDNKIRYASRLQPLRRLESAEWNNGSEDTGHTGTMTPAAPAINMFSSQTTEEDNEAQQAVLEMLHDVDVTSSI